VELLVVLAIIAVLLAVLLPSLAAARRQAQEVVCRSHLRSIFTGVLIYAQVHGNNVPLVEPLRLPEDEAGGGDPPAGEPAQVPRVYDPFDPRRTQAIGNVLAGYVEPDSWVCPSAVAGFPEGAGRGRWTMTYSFRTAQRDSQGNLLPFFGTGLAFLGQGGTIDPVISNYEQLDGRPLSYLSGRRLVFFASGSGQPVPNYNYDPRTQRYWAVRWPLIWDTLGGEPEAGRPVYAHRGRLEARPDLGRAEDQFKANTRYATARTGYMALFADGDVADIRKTREPVVHQQGY
jgi:hypothetical protein